MLARTTWPGGEAGYHDSADANVMVIIIIEEARAVERIDEIAATPGVDVLFIGTSDLSFSLGLRGNQDDPKLEAAIARVVEAGQRHGKFLGRPAATPEIAKRYHGARLPAVPGADRSGFDGRRRKTLPGTTRKNRRNAATAGLVLTSAGLVAHACCKRP